MKMKLIHFLIAAIIFCGYNSFHTVLNAQLNPVFPTTGLVAYYPFDGDSNFDGDTKDHSGNKNHGVNFGATFTAGRGGGFAAEFKGDHFIQIPHSSSLGFSTEQITISLWYAIDLAPIGNVGLINRGCNEQLGLRPTEHGFGNNNFASPGTVSQPPIAFRQWTHFVMVYNKNNLDAQNNNVYLYLNGARVAQGRNTAANFITAESFYIGCGRFSDSWGCHLGCFFNGAIDDVRIYSRALPMQEVWGLYYLDNGQDKGNEGPYSSNNLNSGLVAHFPFNGQQNVANVDVINYHVATNYGATYNATSGLDGSGAYTFDGISARMEIPHSSSLLFSGNEKTISLWYYLTEAPTGNRGLINRGCNEQLGLRQTEHGFGNNNFGSPGTRYVPPIVGKWTHYALVYNNNTNAFDLNNNNVRLYVNGKLVSLARNTAANFATNTAPFYIGCGRFSDSWGCHLGHFFKGKIDEVRIYNRALTTVEVERLYLDYKDEEAPASTTVTSSFAWMPNVIYTNAPVGVAADGASMMRIQIAVTGAVPQGGITVTLQDAANPNQSTGIPLGKIGTTTDPTAASTQVILNQSGYIYYFAPEVFSNDVNNNQQMRQVGLNITGTGITVNGKTTISVIRPPVLLVHGWNSSPKTWEDFSGYLVGSGRYINAQIRLVDYSHNSRSEFAVNQDVLRGNIDVLKRDVEDRLGYVATKFDVIGHSMGGIVARLYAQQPQTHSSRPYRNDINKLITLNTPHFGTQGANYLVDILDDIALKSKLLATTPALGGLGIIATVVSGSGVIKPDDALKDLQIDGDGTKNLNNQMALATLKNNQVPIHTVVTYSDVIPPYDPSGQTALESVIAITSVLLQPISTILEIAEDLTENTILAPVFNFISFVETILDFSPSGAASNVLLGAYNLSTIYNAAANDVVVPVSSQSGGLASGGLTTTNPSTLMPNQVWHSASTKNANVHNRLAQLLELPASSGAFTTNGLNPQKLTYNSNTVLDKLKNTFNAFTVFSISNTSISFVSPTGTINAQSGETLTIEAEGTDDIVFIMFYVEYNNVMMATVGNEFNWDYTIPAEFIGELTLHIIGYDAEDNVYTDVVIVNVQPTATPVELSFTNPETDLLEIWQGFQSSVEISCMFSDNIARDITSLPGVTYSFANDYAIHLGDGIIEGVTVGEDLLTVEYEGLFATLPIVIEFVIAPFDFTFGEFDLIVESNNNAWGAVSTDPEITTDLEFGTDVTLTATAAPGYEFVSWTIEGTEISDENPLTLQVIMDATVVANFALATTATYTLTVASNNTEWGTVSTNPETTTGLADNTMVTLTATAESGYRFVGWFEDDGTTKISSSNPMNIQITGDTGIVAVFAVSKIFRGNIIVRGGGTLIIGKPSP